MQPESKLEIDFWLTQQYVNKWEIIEKGLEKNNIDISICRLQSHSFLSAKVALSARASLPPTF